MEGADECTPSCQSRQHGDLLTAVIMSPMLTDLEVAAYLPLKCRNYAAIWNSAGQSLAHVAAAAGRWQLLRLLLHLRDCLNEADEESGYTPLHVSLLHGEVHCAVRLIQVSNSPCFFCFCKKLLRRFRRYLIHLTSFQGQRNHVVGIKLLTDIEIGIQKIDEIVLNFGE